MKQEILFIILNEYADWEGAFIAACLNAGVMPGSEVKYTPKVVAPTLDAVRSIGGFRTLPDYCFQTMPTDYAALVLIGGMQWNSPEAEQAVPLVKDALQRGKIVGAICNAASFMAKHGFLNNVKHTGNTIQQLKTLGRTGVHQRSRLRREAGRQRPKYRHRQRYRTTGILPRTSLVTKSRYTGKDSCFL